jgi:hypothetical protein
MDLGMGLSYSKAGQVVVVPKTVGEEKTEYRTLQLQAGTTLVQARKRVRSRP